MGKKNNVERRNFTVDELRIVRDEDGGATIEGHAAVFDILSVDLGGFREKIDPGAFTKTIKADDVRSLFNHDANFVLGRNKAGTLELSEDKRGLLIKNALPDTQVARDLATSIDRGDITQMSFGFRTVSDKWETVNEEEIRTLREVKLFDVSPVTFPAYPDTDVAVRSLDTWKNEHSEEEPHYRLAAAKRRSELQELNERDR